MQKVASHFLNNLIERQNMQLLKTHGLSEKRSNHLQHQAVKTSKEVAETTSSKLRTLQTIIKNWKDGGEPSLNVWKKNPKKTAVEHTVVFNT